MAGQFDKFVKILGTSSRPDRFKGAPGQPDIVAPLPEVKGSNTDPNGGGKQAPKKISQRAARYGAMRLSTLRPTETPLQGASSPIAPLEGAVDTKVDKTDEQRASEASEAAFSKSEEEKGSGLRSLNGVTYDLDEYKASLPNRNLTSFPAPYDISEFESKTKPNTSGTSSAPAAPITPAVSAKEPVFTKVAKIKARRGGTSHKDKNVQDFETEHPDSPASSAATGKTLSKANRQITIYNADGSLKPEYDNPNNIHSTTMHETKDGVVEGGVRQAPYTKPTVNKPGNVIPASALDTFANQPGDSKQAAAENKRIRAARSIPTTTTVFDPNKISARPVRGQTPERQAVLGGIREERAASLAAQGKEMTTVAPEVMDTAKRLGRTSRYNLDEDYMNSPSFLSHEAVQKATVAHALGVHHTLGTDDDHLHKYLGGKPLEAKSLLASAFKVVDRNRRGNPEKNAGEFDVLRAAVHAGTTPSRMLRDLRNGKQTDAVVNGQTPTLAPGSSYNRAKTHAKASEITVQTESAPKIARGSIAATPTAPLAGSNRVAVRSIGQSPEEAKIREFSPQELRNKGRVPSVDDSKSKLGPVEKEVESDTSTVTERLKKGKRPEDVADES